MTRWTLPPDKIPSAWFNVAPHLPSPLQPPLPSADFASADFVWRRARVVAG